MRSSLRFSVIFFLVFLATTTVKCAEELKVDVVSKPEVCENKSKSGDMLTMHYTGTLQDGTKFDSSKRSRSERQFVLIKPDGVQKGLVGEIIKRLEQRGLKLIAAKLVLPTEATVKLLFRLDSDETFFKSMVEYMTSGPVVSMVWEGPDAIQIINAMKGGTGGAESPSGTIRGDFAMNTQKNVFHSAHSVQEANRSIELFFSKRELVEWNAINDNFDRDQPFSFQLGVGQVIKGWDQGLLDMCVGEKRKLTIPPHLAYGDRGAGNLIPGGSTLMFDVELINIGDSAPTTNVFKEIDDDKDNQLSREEVSEYLKKQMVAADGEQQSEEVKNMLADHDKLVEEIFQHEDKDKNGFISFDEFSGPKHDEL